MNHTNGKARNMVEGQSFFREGVECFVEELRPSR